VKFTLLGVSECPSGEYHPDNTMKNLQELSPMRKFTVTILLILFVMLSACTRKIGWVGMNYDSKMKASYTGFNGPESAIVRLDAGEEFELQYQVAVEEGGLTLQLTGPGGQVVWTETFRANDEGQFQFTSENGGRYLLQAIGSETRGSYDLSWEMMN
jgi:hypothetical protein